MARILILFAHPVLEKSRIHASLVKHAMRVPDLRIHDLYEMYPDFDINVRKEQKLLLAHDIIIWQHPFYWYSAPAIIKQWCDLVLEHGWAYGSKGKALEGKKVFNVLSCGGSRETYREGGRNRFTMRELLRPFDQTAHLCRMQFLPPFAIHGTHRLEQAGIEEHCRQYQQLLEALQQEQLTEADWQSVDYFNDLLPISSKPQ